VTYGGGCVEGHNLAATTLVFGMVWHDKVIRQFQAVPANPLQSDFYGPYNKFLYALFPVDSDYTVIPQSLEPAPSESSDGIVTFEVFLVNQPILILVLQKPADLNVVSARELADSQIRRRMGDLYGKLWSLFTSVNRC